MDAFLSPNFGSLAIIPREIRDLIYRHVFCDKYCYSPQSNPIGILGASKALRHEALDVLYSCSIFRFEFDSHPFGPSQALLGPSQEIVNRLNQVEITIDMKHYSFELFKGEIRNVENFFKDMFCKLARTDRVRKACLIHCTNASSQVVSWKQISFCQELPKLSTFRSVNIELEYPAIDFEDFVRVDRGPISLPEGYADKYDYIQKPIHMIFVSAKENMVAELKTYLELELGVCQYHYRKNYRCLDYCPRSKY